VWGEVALWLDRWGSAWCGCSHGCLPGWMCSVLGGLTEGQRMAEKGEPASTMPERSSHQPLGACRSHHGRSMLALSNNRCLDVGELRAPTRPPTPRRSVCQVLVFNPNTTIGR
jgi:hypothetical protein